MRASSVLQKDFSNRKLSTEGSVPVSGPGGNPFDPERLVRELLSLGNDKISPPLARRIGQEVQRELERRSVHQWTAELVSEIVQFKLEELGLIEIRLRRRRSLPGGGAGAIPPRGLFQGEDSVDLPGGSNPDLTRLFAEEEWTQPLASAPLRRPPGGEYVSVPEAKPLPPRAELQIPSKGLKALQGKFPQLKAGALLDAWKNLLEGVAEAAARSELSYAGGKDAGLLAVEFFNVMANQEFLPHAPELLDGGGRAAAGIPGIRIPLKNDLASQAQALKQAEGIWQGGASVCFDLARDADSLSREALERFLEAIDRSFLDKMDDSPVSPTLTLAFAAEHPRAQELAETALSGRHFPKIGIQLLWNPETSREASNEAGEKILKYTWKKGEPSFSFLDGGIPLEAGQLGSLNLSVLASGNDVDWAKLRRVIRTAVHFLENRVDAAAYPSEEIRKNSEHNRKIGLGVMGLAELLIKIGIPYDSEDGLGLAEKLMRFIQQETLLASQALAEQRGTFPHYLLSPFARRSWKTRNGALNSVVPISFFAELMNVSPGIEPLSRVVEPEENLEPGGPKTEILPLLKQLGLKHRIWSFDLETEVLERGSVRTSEAAPKALRRLFAIRAEIDPEWELRMQAAFQRCSDGSVGHTLQLPETAELDPLLKALQTARDLGIRTIAFRQNPELSEAAPLEEIPVAAPVEEAAAPEAEESTVVEPIAALVEAPPELVPRRRPELMSANLRTLTTGCGTLTVTLARDEAGPYELQARLGKSGTCGAAHMEAISRLASLLLGVGVDPALIHRELAGIRCPVPAVDHGEPIYGCVDAIAVSLEREFQCGEHEEGVEAEEEEITAIVPRETLH